MSQIRFGRWSGTQEPFGPGISPDVVLAEIADDLLDGVDPSEAIRDLLERGMEGRFSGLAELRERLRQAREAELDRMGLEGPLQQIAERLEEIVELERTSLQFVDDDPLSQQAAAERNAALDLLPNDPAGKLSGLQRYDFHDQGAAEAFEQLLEELRNDIAQATFGQLADAIDATNPEDLKRLTDFMAELNGLVARQEQGEDVQEDFEAFKERYDDLIPGDPETLDDLLEEMAARMAAMNRMLASLSPEQREQLAQMMREAFGDQADTFGALQQQADQLGQTLQGMFPQMGWGQGMPGAPMAGQQSGSLSDTVDWMQRLQQLDDLGQAMGQRYAGARLEDIDDEALRSALGDEAAQDLQAIKEIEQLLERSGAMQRSNGKLELTPKGVRRLGEQSLQTIFAKALDGPMGGHRTPTSGGDSELTGSTRELRFGDPFRVDIARSLTNAIRRGGIASGAEAAAIDLTPDDFELAESERRVKVVTVLLLDMSFSMPLRGNWEHAKRMALALQSLVASKFPQDRFFIVGFSDYARRLQPQDLLVSGWERVYGTNMEHAFRIARRLLQGEPSARQQVIMVTDGEPTSHLMDDGRSFFNWPSHPMTLRKTMAEALRLSRTGCDLNVFMLDHDPGSADFVESMVRRAGGRVFYPDLHDLGSMVVRDFLRRAS